MKVLKKILVVLLIILILNNFLVSSVRAMNPPDPSETTSSEESWLTSMVGSVVGLLTYPVRVVALAASWAINFLTAQIAYIEGTTETAGEVNTNIITPFDIFFNKVKILDVNFFDITEEKSIVNTIRTTISAWYYVLRTLAAAILLVVLIYVGIRMAISTVASEKAMYSKMLVNRVVSLGLIFFLQYIVIFTLTVSNAIVNTISLSVNSEVISNTYEVISNLAFKITSIDSIPATVIFAMLVWQTFGLVISYFNRMLKLAFLLIISPLITLTYSMDKMGDSKAQALSAWLKEFVYTVLIQPFHCIIYMCFINVGFKLLIDNTSNAVSRENLAIAVIAILCIKFVKEAEGIVRKIFSFKNEDSSTSIGAGLAMASLAVNRAKSVGTATRSAVNGAKNLTGMAKATIAGTKTLAAGAILNAKALGATIANSDDEDKSFSERKEEIRVETNDKKADKIAKKYKVDMTKNSKKIEDITAQIMEATPGITKKEARSLARLSIAKKGKAARKEQKKLGRPIRGKITGFKRKAAEVLRESDTLKTVGSLAKGTISAGLGVTVGSGIYGTGGNMATSVMSGIAMFQGSQGFFEHSVKTLTTDVAYNYSALGATGKHDVHILTSQIMEKFSDQDGSKRELAEIMDEIEKALIEAGVEGKYKTQIKNSIQKGIKADPSKTQSVIRFALEGLKNKDKQITGADGKSLYENDAVRNATQKLADYTNESQIYQAIQTAGDFNVDNDTFVESVMKNFKDRDNEDIIAEERNVPLGVPPVGDNNDQANIQSDDEAEKIELARQTQQELEKEFDRVYDSILDEAFGLDTDDLEANERFLRERQADALRSVLLSIKGQKTELDLNIVREYEKQLKNQVDVLKQEKDKLKDDAEKENLEARIKLMTELQTNLSNFTRVAETKMNSSDDSESE